MKQKLLILGASFSYIGCIQAAREMGLTVLVADANPRAVGFAHADIALPVDITDIEGILREARRHGIDGIGAVNDFGVPTAAEVSSVMGLPGITPEQARIATSKHLMRKIWGEHGVPSVAYARTGSFEQFKVAAQRLGFPLIAKPSDSRGGGCRGVIYLDETSDLEEVYAFANGYYGDNDILLERFVQGLEHSVEVIVRDGRCHIVAISDKIKSPLPYRVDDTILYPTVETGPRLVMLEDAVRRSVECLGVKDAVAHVELAVTDDGPVLFEIGLRCGGGSPAPLVPYLCGVEEFKEAARIALGLPPGRLEPAFQRGCVIKFLYPRPGRVRKVEVHGNADTAPGVLSFGLFVGVGDIVSPLRTCSDRAGMVITGGDDRDQALALADWVMDRVTVETEQEPEGL